MRQPVSEPQASPTSGCFIIICAIVILGGGAMYFVYQGLRMDRDIDKFTEAQALDLVLPQPPAAETEALYARLDQFAKAAKAAENGEAEAELPLSADDLNHLIATASLLEDYRGTARITEIDDFFIIAELSQPINRVLPGKPRFLNASFSLTPDLHNNTLSLIVKDISAPGKEIPAGFIQLYSQRRLLQFDPKNELMGPTLSRIHSVFIRDGKVVASTSPPPNATSK